MQTTVGGNESWPSCPGRLILLELAKASGDGEVDENKTVVIFEITLSNLTSQGEIDEKDFMDRAMLLCSLGHIVMISNFKEYYRLVDYLSQYTKKQMALAMGVSSFVEIFDENSKIKINS